MTKPRVKVAVGVVPRATPAEMDEPVVAPVATVGFAGALTPHALPDVVIGDRVHYSPHQGGGPWHGVVIAHTAGVHSLEVTKPNGNHHIVIAAIGTAPGEFVLVT